MPVEVAMRFGEILLDMGFVSQEQLEVSLKEQEYSLKTVQYSEPLGNILLRNGIITEEQHEKALLRYFQQLANDMEQPAYVRETAKVATHAFESKSGGEKLSEESKITLLKKIHEHEEKIAQFEKSISTLSKLEQKRVIVETIEKENREIQSLIHKIEVLKQDIEKFS
jgi:hypothetical protein